MYDGAIIKVAYIFLAYCVALQMYCKIIVLHIELPHTTLIFRELYAIFLGVCQRNLNFALPIYNQELKSALS